ncbi:glycosyltransferase [Desertivirga xinjiangensis]|uniref:glycosyltransferase n=1 Tax=Desertivirga xinjiangensis TaxID=539206 RepID=UPI00210AA9A5|nr:glycosyltransferase [Pedobacter xinjiangensis]
MKISISTIGTRGDVQPYAILGEALAARGHQVTLSTSKNFEELVRSYNIDFHPVNVDYQEILNSEEGSKILKVNIFAIQRNLDRLIYPLIEKSLNECYQLAQSSDLYIYRPKTLSDVFTGRLKTKSIRAAVVPAMEETAAFVNPIFSGFWLPQFLNKWSYKLNSFRYKLLSKPLNQFYQQNGLAEYKPQKNTNELSLYGISEHFLERPKDWSADHQLTGFWFPKRKQNTLSPELSRFLDEGEPPVLITFGSMQVKKEVVSMIIHTACEMPDRFLIVSCWSDWQTDIETAGKGVMIIPNAPFEQLFPKVKAIVHHGGIGTTAESLRAGKPMFVCPVLYPVGDQFFWGDLAYKKNLAVKPIPLHRLTASIFRERIFQLNEPGLIKNCEEMALRISTENGVENAVDLIERAVEE